MLGAISGKVRGSIFSIEVEGNVRVTNVAASSMVNRSRNKYATSLAVLAKFWKLSFAVS